MEEKIYRYPGAEVTVFYDIKRCIHAAECVKGSPDVFDPNRKPWIEPDLAEGEQLMDVITKCPTGALKFINALEEEVVPDKNTITIDPDGPLFVRGNVHIVDAEGALVIKDTRLALCRCGASKNKPLCDLGHDEAGFKDAGNTGESKMKEGEPGEDNALKIRLAKNGPLLFEGQVTIFAADKSSQIEGQKGALCRCGASNNKPFCDGTHKVIGFEG